MASTTTTTKTDTATAVDRLLAQMRAQRTRWVELEPGTEGGQPAKRVQILRPPEAELPDLLTTTADGRHTLAVQQRHVEQYTIGWDGITEADLIGPAGSSEPAPFATALWAAVTLDRVAWGRTVAQAILAAIVEHREAVEADTKN